MMLVHNLVPVCLLLVLRLAKLSELYLSHA